MLSYLDAAFEVLKKENRPMHPLEIAEKALTLGLLKGKSSRNIGHTMWGCIWTDINKRGNLSRFIKISPGQFGLIGWAERYGIDATKIKPKVPEKGRVKKPTSGFSEISDHKVLKMFRDELRDIRTFIKGFGSLHPSYEKLCFWVWFCYHFEFYREGALIFRRIDQNEDKKDLYDLAKKIGLACEGKAI